MELIMSQHKLAVKAARFAVLSFALTTVWYSPAAHAQSGESIEELKVQATALVKQTRLTEALPLLEKIVAAEPKNARMTFNLGFALIAKAIATEDNATKKDLRIRARNA